MTPEFDPYESRLASFKPLRLPQHAKTRVLSELARLDARAPASRPRVHALPAWALAPLALAASLFITLELPGFLTGLIDVPIGASIIGQESSADGRSQAYNLDEQLHVNTVAVLHFAWPGTNRSDRLL